MNLEPTLSAIFFEQSVASLSTSSNFEPAFDTYIYYIIFMFQNGYYIYYIYHIYIYIIYNASFQGLCYFGALCPRF